MVGVRFFVYQLALAPTYTLIQWVQGAFSPEVKETECDSDQSSCAVKVKVKGKVVPVLN
jgi:hypothetical protein